MTYTRDVRKFRLAVWNEPTLPRILIEGDSWADHPLVSNLSWSLHLFLEGQAHILNISESGDLVYNMARGKQFKKLKSYLKSKVLNFDLLFLSGGGNDILVNNNPDFKLGAIVISGSGDNPENYINESIWSRSLKRIEESYRKLLDTTSELSPTLKVVTHSYDYIYPRDNGADIIVIPDALGPWVWPVMKRKGIESQQLQREITSLMLERFKNLMQSLVADYPQLTLVDTQGTLPEYNAWGVNIQDWDDEIHPDSKGFGKLVRARIGPVIKDLI